MGLQGTDRAVMGHGALDGRGDGAGLLGAIGHDDDLLRAQHGGDTDTHRLGRHLLGIIVEEAGINLTGILGQGHDAGAALQRGERLVEGDVAVLADTAEEQVETAGRHDGFLVVFTFLDGVRGVAIEDMDIPGGLVDVVEEVFVHEGVVALRMAFRQAHILVHVEGNDILEGNFTGLDHADQLGVGFNRGAAGAETDHERLVGASGFLIDFGCDVMGGPERTLGGVLADDNFHNY